MDAEAVQKEHEKVNQLIYEWNVKKENFLKQAEFCDEELYKLHLKAKTFIRMQQKPIMNERI
jgi:hypothetical protein